MLLYATLGVCALLGALLVRRYDMFDREPPLLLLATAAAGAAAMGGLYLLEDRAIALLGSTPSSAGIAATAALLEELSRALLVLGVATLFPRAFNDPMDGVVYGSLAGLGMATFESAVHLAALPPGRPIFPAPEVVRLAGHLVLGGIGGFAFGMRRTGIPRWRPALAGCLAAGVLLHFTVDWASLSGQGEPGFWRTLLVIVVMLAGILLYGTLLHVAWGWSRNLFAPGSTRRLVGWPFSVWFPPGD